MKWMYYSFKSLLLIISFSLSAFGICEDKAADCDKDKDPELVATAKQMIAVGEKAKQCPNPGRMSRLCSQIGMGHLNDIKGPSKMGKYMFQQTVYEAACVTPEEWEDGPQEVVAKKVQAAWDKYGKHVTCENVMTTGGANILKYGVANVMDSFLENSVQLWKLPLNYYKDDIDNGRTLLDYVDDQLAGPLGPKLREKFQYYRKLLIKGGAKKRSELK